MRTTMKSRKCWRKKISTPSLPGSSLLPTEEINEFAKSPKHEDEDSNLESDDDCEYDWEDGASCNTYSCNRGLADKLLIRINQQGDSIFTNRFEHVMCNFTRIRRFSSAMLCCLHMRTERYKMWTSSTCADSC